MLRGRRTPSRERLSVERESGTFVPGFGEYFLDRLDVTHVESWRTGIATLITAGDYSPNTCNSWLAILRVIMKAARRAHRLPHLATEDVKDFDTSKHDTYTDEEPNALLPEEVGVFLETLRASYPQFFAMAYLGLSSRGSALRRSVLYVGQGQRPTWTGRAASSAFDAPRRRATR